jgi:hypothetical protein
MIVYDGYSIIIRYGYFSAGGWITNGKRWNMCTSTVAATCGGNEIEPLGQGGVENSSELTVFANF